MSALKVLYINIADGSYWMKIVSICLFPVDLQVSMKFRKFLKESLRSKCIFSHIVRNSSVIDGVGGCLLRWMAAAVAGKRYVGYISMDYSIARVMYVYPWRAQRAHTTQTELEIGKS